MYYHIFYLYLSKEVGTENTKSERGCVVGIVVPAMLRTSKYMWLTFYSLLNF